MISQDFKWYLVWFIAIIWCQHDGDCFFVKHELSGLCFFASNNSYQARPAIWGQRFYLELSKECFTPAAQFRFRSNGAMLSIKKKGCLGGYQQRHDFIALFYVYVGLPTLDASACATKYRRDITQTSGGSLQMNKALRFNPFRSEKRCAVPKSNTITGSTKAKVGINIGITTSCDDFKNREFSFGSLTCHGKTTKDVNCHKDQYMVVKTASYRGLPATEICGLSDNYTCEINATCLVKKLCDGSNHCSITVDDTLFSGNPCPGLSKHLYFEYRCVDLRKIYTGFCALTGPPLSIKAAAISHSSISITWDPPVRYKHNGNVSYTVCISKAENGACSKEYTTTEETLVIDDLVESTKYYVSVRANTIGSVGDYSKSLGVFTNVNTGSFLRVLTNVSSTNVLGKLGERVFLHCAGEGEPQLPEMSFSWEKNGSKLPSFAELQKPYRSSLLIVNLKNITDYGRYICHIRDRFGNKSHIMWIKNCQTRQNMELSHVNEEETDRFLSITGVIIVAVITVILLSITIFLGCRVHVLKRNTASIKKGARQPTQNEAGVRLSALPEDPVTHNDVEGDYEQVDTNENEEYPMYTTLDKSKMKNDENYYTHLVSGGGK